MLKIHNLSVSIDWKKVLKNVNIDIKQGKNYCVVWQNGSWKSSLALTIMGHPQYEITHGDVLIDQQSIKDLKPHQRAEKWIFLAFQNIPEIKGVKLFEFLRTIYCAKHKTQENFISFKKIIIPLLEELKIEKDFLRRDLNVGFSGWEKRKIEILQLKILQPRYIFLDEVDSWLDIDAIKSVAQLIQQVDTPNNSFIIITHYFSILDYIPINDIIVLQNGEIQQKWGKEILQQIKKQGFESIKKEETQNK